MTKKKQRKSHVSSELILRSRRDQRRRRHAGRKELARREGQVPHPGCAAFKGGRDRVSATAGKETPEAVFTMQTCRLA